VVACQSVVEKGDGRVHRVAGVSRVHAVRALRVLRALVAVATVVLTARPLAVGAQTPAAQTPAALVFAGTAEAYGARATLVVPKAPLADTLIDVSAPATRASLSSLGAASGFAAFPSPGETVLSLPGLVGAVANQGGFGLPAFDLPTLPDYPLSVSADAINPEAAVSRGAFEISAEAKDDVARGRGGAGLLLDAGGAVLRIDGTSEVRRDDAQAIASAAVTVDGVTVGPITLGRVRSEATVVLDAGGLPEPSTSFVIEGARIAGIPVTISADGISVVGNTVPLPIGDTLASILAVAGVQIDFDAATEADGTATSPGITITREVDTPGVGTGKGTLELTVGYVTASITTPPPPRPVSPPAVSGGTGTPPAGGGVAAPTIRPTPTASRVTPLPGASPATNDPAPVDLTAAADDLLLTGLAEPIDFKTIYLVLGVGALATIGLGSVIRQLGVRQP
jgi:hypothetical protein